MALTLGSTLGPYEITAQIGAGGRSPALELAERSPATANSYENAPVTRFPRGSEVYKALDTRLDRTVAKQLACSVQLLAHGLRLHLALNTDTRYGSRIFQTQDGCSLGRKKSASRILRRAGAEPRAAQGR